MASPSEIKDQRDIVSASIDAWALAVERAEADATTAASAGAQAETAQQTADASAQLADQKKGEAQAEAQELAEMFGAVPPARRRR